MSASTVGKKIEHALSLPIRLVGGLRSLKCRLIFPCRENQTESGGFEPPAPNNLGNGFRDRRIQPLCQLSFCITIA